MQSLTLKCWVEGTRPPPDTHHEGVGIRTPALARFMPLAYAYAAGCTELKMNLTIKAEIPSVAAGAAYSSLCKL